MRKLCKELLKKGVKLLINDTEKDWNLFYLSNNEFDLSIETVNKNIQIHDGTEKLFYQSNGVVLCNTSHFKVKVLKYRSTTYSTIFFTSRIVNFIKL